MIDAARLQRLLAGLQARAQVQRPAGLTAVKIAGVHVGDAQPAIARFIAQRIDGFTLRDDELSIADDSLDFGARTALLAEAALKLRDAKLVTGWRNEELAIGQPVLATLERAACRALGIMTEAVHLNAYADADTLVVGRRAPHKQFDPGLWDNLVGGMVSAGETLQQALEREAWEEAGLRLDGVSLTRGRHFHMRRPLPEGWQSEIIHVYDTIVAAETSLANQDGEVDAIERRSLSEAVTAIERDEFTLESALVTLESLTRRSGDKTFVFFS